MIRSQFLCAGIALMISFILPVHSQSGTAWKDPSPHAVRFVSVGDGVRLEVLDWGGSGRAVVLLAGGGDTAHVFDDFAPKLATHDHVYGMTRRGFGASGYADAENVGERLGEDVLAVIDALKLDKPILVGHSIAGAELSWMANRYPDRAAGVVYLEAGYSYAFDDGKGASALDMMKLQAPQPPPPGAADLVSFKALQRYDDRVNGFEFPEGELREERQTNPDGTVGNFRDPPGGAMLMKLISGGQKYTRIPVPSLFIFANPHSLGTWVESSADASVRSDAKAYSTTLGAMTGRQEKSVESGVPAAHVITIPNGNHFVFLSNETKCLRAVQAFLSKLSQPNVGISLDGNPGIEVELESSSRRLRERYYIGGRKDFGNIVVSLSISPHKASFSPFISISSTCFLFAAFHVCGDRSAAKATCVLNSASMSVVAICFRDCIPSSCCPARLLGFCVFS